MNVRALAAAAMLGCALVGACTEGAEPTADAAGTVPTQGGEAIDPPLAPIAADPLEVPPEADVTAEEIGVPDGIDDDDDGLIDEEDELLPARVPSDRDRGLPPR